jgi:hypothetical protein
MSCQLFCCILLGMRKRERKRSSGVSGKISVTWLQRYASYICMLTKIKLKIGIFINFVRFDLCRMRRKGSGRCKTRRGSRRRRISSSRGCRNSVVSDT